MALKLNRWESKEEGVMQVPFQSNLERADLNAKKGSSMWKKSREILIIFTEAQEFTRPAKEEWKEREVARIAAKRDCSKMQLKKIPVQ